VNTTLVEKLGPVLVGFVPIAHHRTSREMGKL
jgi:hypothetical protein